MTASNADLRVSIASEQYVRVPISEVTGADPTGDNVYMAFPVAGVDPSVFYAGSWMTLSGIYYARCLVGPSGPATLPIDYYDVYVKVSDDPETPVLYSGTLEVF